MDNIAKIHTVVAHILIFNHVLELMKYSNLSNVTRNNINICIKTCSSTKLLYGTYLVSKIYFVQIQQKSMNSPIIPTISTG